MFPRKLNDHISAKQGHHQIYDYLPKLLYYILIPYCIIRKGNTPRSLLFKNRLVLVKIFPMRTSDFSTVLILPAALCPLGSTQPLTEMSTRNLPGFKARQARKEENSTAICEPIVYKMWESRRLTILRASAACYRNTFTIFYIRNNLKII
jgi:hypothetical protein